MTDGARSAVVIGAGIGGLCAAAYLARAGIRTTVVEARPIVGGAAETAMLGDTFRIPLAAHVFYALDRRMVRELALHRHGLVYAEKMMPTVALRSGGGHLVLSRDAFTAKASINALGSADAEAYVAYRRELFAFGRAMRPLWMAQNGAAHMRGDDPLKLAVAACALSSANTERLEALMHTSASAYLDRWFENDALKAPLAFDVCLHGVSPVEAGSALLLAWRAAQEIAGRQAATTQIRGGPLTLAAALANAAQKAGAQIRTGTKVSQITVWNGKATGVVLSSGETIEAASVVSNLGRAGTLALAPPEAVPLGEDERHTAPAIGCAKVMLGLNGPVPIAGLGPGAERGRIIVAERPETLSEAKGAALAGKIPRNLVMEVVIASAADPAAAPVGQSAVSVLVPFLPATIEDGWEPQHPKLLRRVVTTLETYAPGIADRMIENCVATPDAFFERYGCTAPAAPSIARLLAPHEARVRTPIPGVYLCGSAAEPANALSGTAGRVAANLVVKDLPAEAQA